MYRFLGRCPGFSRGSHTPNRLLGHRDGAQGFRADHPKPRNDSGQRLSAPQQTTSQYPRDDTVCSVWLQELQCLQQLPSWKVFAALCLANSRIDGHILVRPSFQLAEHTARSRTLRGSGLPQAPPENQSPPPAACARSRTLRRSGLPQAPPGNQTPQPAAPGTISDMSRRYSKGTSSLYFSCVPAMLHSQLVIPKPPIQIVRGSTLVLSQEPRPKQGMAARHP